MSDGSFQRAIKDGAFVVTAEYATPKGSDPAQLKSFCASLNGKVQAIYAPESEHGPSLSSLAACAHLIAAGAEPIMALLTRDMNRIALQSCILGAASLGVGNILCTTGRHQALTTSKSARGVFDVDPVQLLRIADSLRKSGELADGTRIDSPLDLTLGVDTNPTCDPVDLQVITLEKAIRAGADFAITQPVFDLNRFDIWIRQVRERGLHQKARIIASVMPLTSAQQAAGLPRVREQDITRLDAASDPRAIGIEMAVEAITHLRKTEGVRGVHLMAGGDPALTADVAKAAGL